MIDGRDITPLMMGREGARSPHNAFYYHDGKGRLKAVRSGPWKLHLGKDPVLNNLTTDIGEQINVAHDHPAVVQRLREQAQAFTQKIEGNSRPIGVMKEE